MAIAQEKELCPACGDFVDLLNDETGWCADCSGDVGCFICGKFFKKDKPHRKMCPNCRDERWLQAHADELEELLSFGAHITFAKREVYRINRPICLSCKQPIKGAAQGANFCTQTVECRRWKRRYRTLREKYHDSKLAASQVAAEIFAAQYKTEISK